MNNLLTTLFAMEKTYKVIVIILLLVISIFSVLSYIKINNVYWDLDVVYRIVSDNWWKLIQQDNSIEDIKSDLQYLESTLVHYE